MSIENSDPIRSIPSEYTAIISYEDIPLIENHIRNERTKKDIICLSISVIISLMILIYYLTSQSIIIHNYDSYYYSSNSHFYEINYIEESILFNTATLIFDVIMVILFSSMSIYIGNPTGYCYGMSIISGISILIGSFFLTIAIIIYGPIVMVISPFGLMSVSIDFGLAYISGFLFTIVCGAIYISTRT